MRARPERVSGALLAAAAMCLASPAVSAEYSIGGLVYGEAGYNDNIQLAAEDKVASGIGIVAGEVNLKVRTPVLELGLDGAADIYRYNDASELDTDNQFILGFARGDTRRATYAIEASFRRDSELADQFSATGPEQDSDRRETILVTPSFGYLLTPRDSLFANASFQRQTFASSDEDDSDLWGGTLGVRRDATRRTRLGGQISASLFDSSTEEAVQISPQAYVGYLLEDRIDLSVAIGPSWIRTDQTDEGSEGGGDDSGTEFGFSADGRMTLAVTRATEVSVGLARALDQSGEDGAAVERTRVDASIGHQLSGQLRLQIDGSAQRRSGLGDNTGDDTVDAEIGPVLRHRMSKRVELSLGYRWRYTAPDDGGDATSSAVFIRLTYIVPTFRLVR